MHLEYDTDADALYVQLRQPNGPVNTEFIDVARYVDYDADGNVIGVELLGVSQGVDFEGLPDAERIAEALNTVPRPGAG
jgi:uncharacterized protein YuzE